MRILFIGDIVGRVGRRMVKQYLPTFVDKYHIDFVIANGENVTHGKGLLRHHYFELIESGVDVVTLGNHYDSKNDLRRYIEQTDRLIRPINLLHPFPGEGSAVFDVNGVSVRVTNILGSAMMKEEVNSPYVSLSELLNDEDEEEAVVHIIDFHAEATGEKICFAYAFDGKVSAVLGTHTHVQTKDAKILEGGTAFISDVGMTGFADGALGFDKNTVMNKIIYGEQSRFDLPNEGRGLFSAVVIDVDDYTGKAKEIFPIYYQEEQ